MLTEPHGMIHQFLIYAGSRDPTVDGTGHSAKVVQKLCEQYKEVGHSLYMDNFYNSPVLAQKLLDNKTYVTGTLRQDRNNVPDLVAKKALKTGEIS